MHFEFGPFIFALIIVAIGLLLVHSVGVRPSRDQQGREEVRREELRRAELNYARQLRANRQRPPLQIELERERLWEPGRGRGADKDAGAGGDRPAEITAGVEPSPAGGEGPRVIEPGEPELVPGTLLHVSEGSQPVLWTLLEVDAGLRVVEPNGPEFVPGPQAGELTPETLLRVDAGLQPEPVPVTLLQPAEITAGVEPSPAGGEGPQVIEPGEPELIPATLLLVVESGSGGARPAQITADDLMSAFETFVSARPSTGD